jgi:hypothetical protein
MQQDLAQTYEYNHWGNISSLVGNIGSNNCLYLEQICGRQSSYNWTLESQAIMYGLQLSYVLLKKKKKDSFLFLPQKRANEISNLTPVSISRLRDFNYSLF